MKPRPRRCSSCHQLTRIHNARTCEKRKPAPQLRVPLTPGERVDIVAIEDEIGRSLGNGVRVS